MQTYIAILRGINVSGQKIIKMAELREHLSSLGFSNLATYIQSGNIVFQSEPDEDYVFEDKIHKNIKDNYGFEVPVIVRSIAEWQKIVKVFPFNDGKREITRLAVVFLMEAPVQVPLEEIEKYKASDDELEFHGKEIYLHIPGGFGKSKITNNVFEKKLKVSATTRNWKTTIKLLAMAEEL